MFEPFVKTGNVEEDDKSFCAMVSYYLDKDDEFITTLSNASALLAWYLEDVSWLGFYLFDGKELYLGPFQGLPACTKIKLGSGVCGISAEERKTLNIPDVSLFPTYIACEGDVKSELVSPLLKDGKLLGVLDADSNSYSRFTEREERLFEAVCSFITRQ